jgi:hypothetical protein
LRHRDEGDVLAIEDLDQAGEVGEGAGQPVDLVEHDGVDGAAFDLGQRAAAAPGVPECRPRSRHRIAGGEQLPAFVALAANIGLAGLALGIE